MRHKMTTTSNIGMAFTYHCGEGNRPNQTREVNRRAHAFARELTSRGQTRLFSICFHPSEQARLLDGRRHPADVILARLNERLPAYGISRFKGYFVIEFDPTAPLGKLSRLHVHGHMLVGNLRDKDLKKALRSVAGDESKLEGADRLSFIMNAAHVDVPKPSMSYEAPRSGGAIHYGALGWANYCTKAYGKTLRELSILGHTGPAIRSSKFLHSSYDK